MAGTYVIFCSLQECTRTLSTYGAGGIRIFVLRRERKGLYLTGAEDGDSKYDVVGRAYVRG